MKITSTTSITTSLPSRRDAALAAASNSSLSVWREEYGREGVYPSHLLVEKERKLLLNISTLPWGPQGRGLFVTRSSGWPSTGPTTTRLFRDRELVAVVKTWEDGSLREGRVLSREEGKLLRKEERARNRARGAEYARLRGDARAHLLAGGSLTLYGGQEGGTVDWEGASLSARGVVRGLVPEWEGEEMAQLYLLSWLGRNLKLPTYYHPLKWRGPLHEGREEALAEGLL